MISLDDLDRGIVRLLQTDARMSSREIAGRLGNVSDRVVRYRIDRLIRNGVILAHATINPSAVGLPIVAHVLIDVVPWKLSEVAAELAAMAPVCLVRAAFKGNKLSIEINARTEYELMSFVQRVVNHIEGVVHTHTMIVPHLIKDPSSWEIPRTPGG